MALQNRENCLPTFGGPQKQQLKNIKTCFNANLLEIRHIYLEFQQLSLKRNKYINKLLK